MKKDKLSKGFVNAASSIRDINIVKKNISQKDLEIPKSYGENRVIVLPVNPHLCFSYWEITEALFQKRKKLKARLYDDNKEIVYEFKIGSMIGDYYINTYLSDKKIQLIIGYDEDGKFVELLHSNVIIVPRDYMIYADVYEKGGVDKKEWLKIIEEAKDKQQFSASFLKQEELIRQINKRMNSSYMGVYNV